MAAAIGLVQNDIKRVLAYSTISQLGYMFLAAGVGAFGAAVFHLATHAFFKALLFLGSGSVIHALGGEQDMRRMGGLRGDLPVTFVTMSVAALALAGIPPLSGFFSKDAIQFHAFGAHPLLFVVALATTMLTAAYISRLMILTFFGAYRGPARSAVASPAAATAAAIHGVAHPRDARAHGQAQREEHEVTHGPASHALASTGPSRDEPSSSEERTLPPHEAPGTMPIPMMVLAAGAAVAGFAGIPAALGGADALGRFLEPSFEPARALAASSAAATTQQLPRGPEAAVMALSVLGGVRGHSPARYSMSRGLSFRIGSAATWPRVHALLYNQFYVDALYDAIFVRGTLAGAGALRSGGSPRCRWRCRRCGHPGADCRLVLAYARQAPGRRRRERRRRGAGRASFSSAGCRRGWCRITRS